MFPRYIDKKVFTFPGLLDRYTDKDFPLRVVAHEMLHFITYDYLQNKYKLKPSEWSSKNNTFWQFTENLNVLIENEKSWHKINGGAKSNPYPNCVKLYQKMKRVWDKNKDIDNLIEKILVKK